MGACGSATRHVPWGPVTYQRAATTSQSGSNLPAVKFSRTSNSRAKERRGLVRNVTAKALATCSEACSEEPACQYFVYHGAKSVCLLQKDFDFAAGTFVAGATSGFRCNAETRCKNYLKHGRGDGEKCGERYVEGTSRDRARGKDAKRWVIGGKGVDTLPCWVTRFDPVLSTETDIGEMHIKGLDFTRLDRDSFLGVPTLNLLDLSNKEDLSNSCCDKCAHRTGFRYDSCIAGVQCGSRRSASSSAGALASIEGGAFTGLALARYGNTRGLLDLSGNRLRVLRNGTFAGLTAVTLDVSNNPITAVEQHAFFGCTIHALVDLRSSKIERLQAGAFAGLALHGTLDLSSGRVRSIEAGSFGSAASPIPVRTLDLGGNNVSTVCAGAFAGLASLTQLYICEPKHHNAIQVLEPGCFKGLDALPRLALTGMAIGELQTGTFEGLPRVTSLDLGDSTMSTIRRGAFGGLWLLPHLYEGEIDDETFNNSAALQVLVLSDNKLTAVQRRTFSGLESLVELHLDGNHITAVAAGSFTDLRLLTSLLMSGNALRVLKESTFASLVAVEMLDLRDNPLAMIQANWLAPQLGASLKGLKLDPGDGPSCSVGEQRPPGWSFSTSTVTTSTTPRPPGKWNRAKCRERGCDIGRDLDDGKCHSSCNNHDCNYDGGSPGGDCDAINDGGYGGYGGYGGNDDTAVTTTTASPGTPGTTTLDMSNTVHPDVVKFWSQNFTNSSIFGSIDWQRSCKCIVQSSGEPVTAIAPSTPSEVVYCATFQTVAGWDSRAEAVKYGVETEYTVGQTYETCALTRGDPQDARAACPATLKVSSFLLGFGLHSDITFRIAFENNNIPGGHFLSDSYTGATLAVLSRAGQYSAQLLAVNTPTQKTTPVLEWDFAVHEKQNFSTAPGWNVADATAKVGARAQLVIGETYQTSSVTTAAKSMGIENLFINCFENNCAKVSYTLEFAGGDSPGNFFSDASTGATLAEPAQASNYSVTIQATDRDGSTAPVLMWDFEVVDKKVFGVATGWDPKAKATLLGVQPDYVIGETYHTTDVVPAGQNKSAVFVNCFEGDCSEVSFKLEFVGGRTPGSFLSNAATGATLATPNVTGNYSGSLVASDRDGSTAVVMEWNFSVVQKQAFTTVDDWNPGREMPVAIVGDVNGKWLHVHVVPAKHPESLRATCAVGLVRSLSYACGVGLTRCLLPLNWCLQVVI